MLWDPLSDKFSTLTFLPTHMVLYSNDVQVYTLEIFMSELLKVFLILGYLCIKSWQKMYIIFRVPYFNNPNVALV